MSAEAPPVVDNRDEERFEVVVDGHRADLSYRRYGKRLVLTHTEVPESLEGRGIGSALVRAALDAAVAENLTLVSKCPFASSWLEKHPDEARRASIDWRASSSPGGQ